jgi:ATP-dependent Clp protease ATP-binding subunit ClpA
MISENAKEILLREGFDPNLGARPLKRIIQRPVFL